MMNQQNLFEKIYSSNYLNIEYMNNSWISVKKADNVIKNSTMDLREKEESWIADKHIKDSLQRPEKCDLKVTWW